MDFIIELISEIFLEGFIGYAKSKKAPRLFRVFVFTILILIGSMLLYWSYTVREDSSVMLFMGILGLIVFGYTRNLWIQIQEETDLG